MLRALQVWGAIILLSAPVFAALAWRPAARGAAAGASPDPRLTSLDAAVMRRLRTAAAVGCGWVILATLAQIFHLGSLLADAPIPSRAALAAAGELLRHSATGALGALRIVLALAGWAAARSALGARPGHLQTRRGQAAAAAAFACGATALATLAFTSHAVTVPHRLGLSLALELLHLLAAAMWGGAVWHFTLMPWRLLLQGENRPLVGILVRRVSALAIVAVPAVITSGAAIAVRNVYGVSALWETPYGVALAWKGGFLAMSMAAARHTLLFVRPQLGAATLWESASGLLRRNLRTEAAGILAAALATAALALAAPPQERPLDIGPITVADLRYHPARITIPRGRPVRITLVNRDRTVHSLVISGLPYTGLAGHAHGPARSTDAALYAWPYSRETMVLTALRPGSYRIFCAVDDHARLGLAGTLTVR